MRDVLVELDVLVGLDLGPGARPQRLGPVDRLGFGVLARLAHPHGEGDVVGVLADERAEPDGVEKLGFFGFEREGHHGAPFGLLHGLHRVAPVAAAAPQHGFTGRQPRAPAQHLDALGHDEGGVEADAELPDEMRVLLGFPAQGLQESGRSRVRDRAQLLDDLLAAHPDAGVADGQDALVRIHRHGDLQLGLRLQQLGRLERLESQLVIGIGGVGDELPKEDLLVAVKRVDHEVEQLLHLSLEAEGGRFLHAAHR